MEKLHYTKEQALKAVEMLTEERLKMMPVLSKTALIGQVRQELSGALKEGAVYDSGQLAAIANEKLKPYDMRVTKAEIDGTGVGTKISVPPPTTVTAPVDTSASGSATGGTTDEAVKSQRALADEQAAASGEANSGWNVVQVLVAAMGWLTGLGQYGKSVYKAGNEYVDKHQAPAAKEVDGLIAGTWNGISNLFTRAYTMFGMMLTGQGPTPEQAPRENEIVNISGDNTSKVRNPELDEFNKRLQAHARMAGAEPELGTLSAPSTPQVPGQQVARGESMAPLPPRRS